MPDQSLCLRRTIRWAQARVNEKGASIAASSGLRALGRSGWELRATVAFKEATRHQQAASYRLVLAHLFA